MHPVACVWEVWQYDCGDYTSISRFMWHVDDKRFQLLWALVILFRIHRLSQWLTRISNQEVSSENNEPYLRIYHFGPPRAVTPPAASQTKQPYQRDTNQLIAARKINNCRHYWSLKFVWPKVPCRRGGECNSRRVPHRRGRGGRGRPQARRSGSGTRSTGRWSRRRARCARRRAPSTGWPASSCTPLQEANRHASQATPHQPASK